MRSPTTPTASEPSMTSRGRSSADVLVARLAAASRLVADQLATSLPAAQTALGTGVARWLELATVLAEQAAPAATLALLRLEPAHVRRAGLDALARWVD